jgi:hypothetical protein
VDGPAQLTPVEPDGVDLERRVSRTGLLKLGAVAAFVVGTGGTARAFAGDKATAAKSALDLRTRVAGPRYLRLATYVPLVGTSFRVQREHASPFTAKLVSAARIEGEGEAFSLIFRGSGREVLEQETYTLAHPSVGTFPLFLVPVGRPAKTQDLQAVVYRIAGA